MTTMIAEKAKRTYVHPGPIVKQISKGQVSGAKVLFINMPLRESASPNCAPTGIALLAAQLLQWDVNVAILDLNAYRVKDSESEARGLPNGRIVAPWEVRRLLETYLQCYGDQDVIAMSGMITTLRWQEEVCRLSRKLQPKAMIVSGNGLATEFKEGLFRWIPDLDAVAHSEGDLSIIKIVHDAALIKRVGIDRALASGKLKPYYLGEIGGRHRFVYDGGRPDDLDAMPRPAYELLENDVNGFPVLETYLKSPIWGLEANNSSAAPFTMNRSINMISSRGCPFACHFCFRGATGERNYGVRSAESMAREMRFYVNKYHVDFIGVLDDNALVSRQRIADMVPVVGDLCRSTGVRWGTHGRLDEAADLKPVVGGESKFNSPLRVDQMAAAGCVYIGFGAESASPKTLQEMGKGGFILSNGTTRFGEFDFPTTMVEGVKNTKRARIHANLTWIAGYPGEDLQGLKTTVAFIQWQREYYASFGDSAQSVNEQLFTATYYPGTEMGKNKKVQDVLHEKFGVTFDTNGNPVCDEALHRYVLELDDATKILTGRDGQPVYYGDMTIDQFQKCRELIDAGRTMDILSL